MGTLWSTKSDFESSFGIRLVQLETPPGASFLSSFNHLVCAWHSHPLYDPWGGNYHLAIHSFSKWLGLRFPLRDTRLLWVQPIDGGGFWAYLTATIPNGKERFIVARGEINLKALRAYLTITATPSGFSAIPLAASRNKFWLVFSETRQRHLVIRYDYYDHEIGKLFCHSAFWLPFEIEEGCVWMRDGKNDETLMVITPSGELYKVDDDGEPLALLLPPPKSRFVTSAAPFFFYVDTEGKQLYYSDPERWMWQRVEVPAITEQWNIRAIVGGERRFFIIANDVKQTKNILLTFGKMDAFVHMATILPSGIESVCAVGDLLCLSSSSKITCATRPDLPDNNGFLVYDLSCDMFYCDFPALPFASAYHTINTSLQLPKAWLQDISQEEP